MSANRTPEMFPNFPGAGRSHGSSSRSDFDAIIHTLNGKRNGSTAMVLCPAHNDRNPSLSVRLVDGKVLVCCQAGCQQADVVAALKALGLWRIEARESSGSRRTEQKRSPSYGADWPVVAVYNYTDDAGEIVYQVRRQEGEGDKTFRPWRPDGRGGFVLGGPDASSRVLYHLPEVLKSSLVFIVEGEKDADTLQSLGYVATTNAFGSKQPWLPQYTAALAGREVVLIPDNDEPGRAHTVKVARALLGKVSRLAILELEGAKDCTEWFEAGNTREEFIAALEHGAVCQ